MTSYTLVLLRHGKAVPSVSGRSDAERPLSDTGRRDAAAAGAWLAENGLIPDLVLCSPARRAVQTWQAAARAANVPRLASLELTDTGAGVDPSGLADVATTGSPVVTYEPRLYTDGVTTLLGLLADLPGELTTVLILGHNPTISLASALLSPPFDGAGLATTGIAVHKADVPWSMWDASGAPLIRSHTARAETE